MIDLSMLLFGRMQILRLRIWKAVECYKWGLMGYPSRSMKDFVTEDDLNCGSPGLMVSGENNFNM